MIERDDQDRYAQRIRQQNELLALLGAGLPHISQKLNGADPLRFGQLYVPNEVVQMGDQRRHDLLESRISALRETLDHCLGNALLIEFTHDLPLVSRALT